MKKWGKRVGIALGVIVALVLIATGGAYAASASKESRVYEVEGASFAIPTDPESIAEGERLFVARGCASPDCHAPDGGGHALEMGPIGVVTGANLTRIADRSAADWDRAVRHGLRQDGTSLVFMPAVDFQDMSDRELGMIVAYVRTLPRVERELAPTSVGMLGRVIDLSGGFVLFPAAEVDHEAVAHPDPEPGRTVEYGENLARLCTGCHGATFSGGTIPGAPAEMGVPLNLTPHETGLAGWTEEQFRTVLRTGVTPSGHQIDERQMPYPAMGRMTDDEIGAIFLYLQSLPPIEEGNR